MLSVMIGWARAASSTEAPLGEDYTNHLIVPDSTALAYAYLLTDQGRLCSKVLTSTVTREQLRVLLRRKRSRGALDVVELEAYRIFEAVHGYSPALEQKILLVI